MPSQKNSYSARAEALASEPVNLNQMNDLYSLELSQVLLRAMETGAISPVQQGDKWVFQIQMCPRHQMVDLPMCLMCINEAQAEGNQVATAA